MAISGGGEHVFFLRLSGAGSVQEGEIVEANYRVGDRYYLLNADPGEYIYVGGSTFRMGAKDTDVLDQKSSQATRFKVESGKMNYAGEVSMVSAKQPDDWATKMLERIAPGSSFSVIGFRRAALKAASFYSKPERLQELKAEVAGDLGNTVWADLSCPLASCKSSDRDYSVDSSMPGTAVVSVLLRDCYHVSWIKVEDSRGQNVIYNLRWSSGFKRYLDGSFRVAPGKVTVRGACFQGNARTADYTVDLGQRNAGETVVICAKVEKKFFSSTGKVETTIQPSEKACNAVRGIEEQPASQEY